MAEYGKYGCTDSVIAVYINGKPICLYENVIPETIFLMEDNHRIGKHIVSFDYMLHGEKESRKLHHSFDVYAGTSFQIFPSWMAETLRKVVK